MSETIEELENGHLLVHTKQGDFELQEMPYKTVTNAKKRATRFQNGNESINADLWQLMLISESLVKPVLPELEIEELNGSTVFKLIKAVNQLYDLNSFLQE